MAQAEEEEEQEQEQAESQSSASYPDPGQLVELQLASYEKYRRESLI